MSYQKLTMIFMGAAISAGKAILSVYNTDFETFKKSDNSPVTKADQLAEDQIIQTITRDCNDFPIVSEELVSNGKIPEIENSFILIDPLDGTKEFIERNGEFTVNIALIESGRPQCAVIFAPYTAEMFLSAGFESYRTQIRKDSIDEFKKLSVRSTPKNGIKALISRSHDNDATKDSLQALSVSEIEKVGSAIKFCRLAEGVADFYPRYSPTKQWDSAAGDCILSHAGGKVVDTNMNQLKYSHSDKSIQEDFENPFFLAVGDQRLLTQYQRGLVNVN